MSGPVASNLVLLGELPECKPGIKVRFLGCVDEYLVETATLRLKHDYPPSNPLKLANVDIGHVLERTDKHQIDVGTWLNVIGEVKRQSEKGIFVQAIAVWDAGNVDLEVYQKGVQARKESILN